MKQVRLRLKKVEGLRLDQSVRKIKDQDQNGKNKEVKKVNIIDHTRY